MLNCAHPSHFERVLGSLGEHRERLRGLRANASRRSHAELDAATELDDGNPRELGADYARLNAAVAVAETSSAVVAERTTATWRR